MNKGFLVWEDRFSLGHERIDSQHQQIVEMFNDLYESRFHDMEQEVMSEVIEQMRLYISEHFSYEEKIMTEIGFPERSNHCTEHAFFIAEVKKMYSNWMDGEAHIDPLMDFLKEWFLEHIGKTDQQYKAYLK